METLRCRELVVEDSSGRGRIVLRVEEASEEIFWGPVMEFTNPADGVHVRLSSSELGAFLDFFDSAGNCASFVHRGGLSLADDVAGAEDLADADFVSSEVSDDAAGDDERS